MDECNDINNCRTRIGIVTSCISTISLCTWAVFHPNIPGPKEPTWKVVGRRIGCMIGGILAPEIYLFLALRQFIAAAEFARICALFEPCGPMSHSDTLISADRELGWTRTHGFFALMGGFMIYDGQIADKIGFYDPTPLTRPFINVFIHDFISLEAFERRLSTRDSEYPDRRSPTQRLGQLVHSLAALKYIQSDPATFEGVLQQVDKDHGISIGQCIDQVEWYNQHLSDHATHLLYEGREEERLLLKGTLAFLTAYVHPTSLGENENTDHTLPIKNTGGSELAIGNSRLAPRVNIEDIRDKSKNDGFAKSIAAFQVAWFMLQLTARIHEKLSITELEIFTFAFCVIALITTILWRNKPFTVGRGYAIRWRDDGWEAFIPPVPPFVEASQVTWIHWCRKGIARIMKGIKQVLTTYGPLRHVDSVDQAVPEPTEGPPLHLPRSSVETTSPLSYRSSQPFVGPWQKLKFTLSKLGKGIEIAREVVFQQIPIGQTILRDSGKRVSTLSPRMAGIKGDGVGSVMYYSMILYTIEFGVIHFLSWYAGPTSTDRSVWRMCSISATVLPLIIFYYHRFANFLNSLDYKSNRTCATIAGMISIALPLFYILARIGLLVVIVRGLIYCHPSALQTVSWAQLIPHL